jgi:hypothetical protein
MTRRSQHRSVVSKFEMLTRLRIPNDGKFAEWPRRAKKTIKRLFRRRVRRRLGDDDAS